MTVAPPANRYQAAGQALDDVQALICDVRDLDPAVVWREITRWSPQRIAVACIALAAIADPDEALHQRLSWLPGVDTQDPT